MHALNPAASGLPPLTGEARAAFARLTHATAHEVMALRALNARMLREGVRTVDQVHCLIGEMLAERASLLGLTPDAACAAYEAAHTGQLLDTALVRGQVAHA